MTANGVPRWVPVRTWSDRRPRSPNAIRPYRDLGFETVIVRMPAPYDAQTIERIGEVDALLEGRRPG